MKKSIITILSISLLAAILGTKPSLATPTNDDENIGTKAETKLPLLATYINEIHGSKTLSLEDDEVIFPAQNEDYSDYDILEYFNPNEAQFKDGWEGTAGIEQNRTTYRLLNNDSKEPIVLVISQSKFSERSFSEMSWDLHELEEELTEMGVKKDIPRIAELMYERRRNFNDRALGNLTNHRLEMLVWKKSQGIWKDFSSTYMPPEVIEQFIQHFPFFEATKKEKQMGYLLTELHHAESKMLANKENYENWFGANENPYELNLTLEENDIIFEITKDKSIRWKWDGAKYSLTQLPKKVDLITTSCSEIDWKSGGTYSYKGIIGADIPIEMKINLTPNTQNMLLEGEYWYSNKPSSKFPIKGNIYNDNSKAMVFHRMKGGEVREEFDFVFYNCKLEGYWQHLGTMNIYTFTMELKN